MANRRRRQNHRLGRLGAAQARAPARRLRTGTTLPRARERKHMATTKRYDVKDLALAPEGVRRIAWADRQMPVLAAIRDRFEAEQPLSGYRISACLHVTTETANLARTLKAGGADVVLCASNPLSTQDDVAAALVDEYDVSVFAIKGEDNDTYYQHIEAAVDHKPQITMDDGADVIGVLHAHRREQLGDVVGGTEETTTGVIRLKALERDGAHVIVTEVDALKALEAVMDGFEVLPMAKAAEVGDIFVTATGDKGVIRREHMEVMKDGAILANTGHFNVEIDIPALRAMASESREARQFVDEFVLDGGRRIYLLADGRLVNLAAAEGHPAQVMDMSFANQALSAEFIVGNATSLRPLTDDVPKMLLPLAERPMLDYLVDRVREVDEIDEIHLVTNALFADAFREWAPEDVTVHDDGTISNEDRLGAIGDIAFALERGGLEREDLLIVAGDNLIGYSLAEFVDFWRGKDGSAIAVRDVADRELLKQYGVVELDEDDRVIALEEKPAEPKSDLAATASYLYRAEHLAHLPGYL